MVHRVCFCFVIGFSLLVGCKKSSEPSQGPPTHTAASQSQVTAGTGQGQQPSTEKEKTEAALLEDFLKTHPSIAADFENHPSLKTDADYEDEHPDWKYFLSQHPKLREYLREKSDSRPQ
jgi:hypothetical protein